MDYPYAERLKAYRFQVDFCLEQGEGPVLRAVRETVGLLSLADQEAAELADIDAVALEYILGLGTLAPYLLTDDDSQPLSHWWWHLGKLQSKTFPVEQLPASLQTVYAVSLKGALNRC
ncbi:hypothetical protein [Methylicorpusculum sp.]|uniref:hypothetical protein n=1 Tax=Methylicorpusculum sp. TaxID=2713644 RepID=UPI002ABADC91|nr:hypothetical protein [Methylicorpusculum sp.]MDZ4154420.1 hypothetical protein [Methylicorpusculum sp.]